MNDGEQCAGGKIIYKDTCRTAASYLGLVYSGEWNSNGQWIPPGCIRSSDGKVYFNLDLTATGVNNGMAGICERRGILKKQKINFVYMKNVHPFFVVKWYLIFKSYQFIQNINHFLN